MINQIFAFFARRALVSRTYRELSVMTDRDLSDIGITRMQIREIANLSAAR